MSPLPPLEQTGAVMGSEVVDLQREVQALYERVSSLSVKNEVFTRVTTNPSGSRTGVNGERVVFDDGVNYALFINRGSGTTWQQLASSAAADHGLLSGLLDDDHPQYVLRSILTANGDIFIRSGGVVVRLAVGGAGSVLGVSGGLPAWQAQTYVDHGSLGGLADDDHTQYALLAGRAGGQTLNGGTAASENLTLHSTSHATKGNVVVAGGIQPLVTDTYNIGTDSTGLWGNVYALRFHAGIAFQATFVGSAGSPNHTWTTDPDTGLYNIGADIFGIAVGGFEALRITETGGKHAARLLGTALIQETLTTNGQTGVFGDFDWTAGAGSATVIGGLFQLFYTGGNFTGQNLYGLVGRAEVTSSVGTVAVMVGVRSEIGTDEPAGGAVTDAYGFQATAQSTFYKATRVAGLRVENMGGLGTTARGLWIAAQTGGTTNWAISSEGGDSYHVGNLRIGSTVAPTNALSVTGSMDVSGHSAIGTSVSAFTLLNLSETLVNQAVSRSLASTFTAQSNLAVTDVAGIFNALTWTGSGTSSTVDGIQMTVTTNGTGTLARMAGMTVKLFTLAASGLVTAATGVLINSPSYTVAPTTGYGLRINSQTGATTNWAIAADGGSSYHVGNLRIGSTVAPTVALDVTGAGKISTFLNVGPTTSAVASGDLACGSSGDNEMFYDNSLNLLQFSGLATDATVKVEIDADGTSMTFFGGIIGTTTVHIEGATTGTTVFNETGSANLDFRVEGDTQANLLFVDASADSVGFGTATPTSGNRIHVSGKAYVSGELEVDGALNHDGTTAGFFAIAPVARASAYTQTFSTADKTHAAFTSADIGAFAGGLVGFTSAAERDNIRTQFNALRADVDDVKQLCNAIIDDLQAYGLFQ